MEKKELKNEELDKVAGGIERRKYGDGDDLSPMNAVETPIVDIARPVDGEGIPIVVTTTTPVRTKKKKK